MKYDRIAYTSFMWKLGTTSFRTKEFNCKTERQLALLDDFWKLPDNADQGWEKKYMAKGQKDIYEIKVRYYDYLVDNGFMKGGEPWDRKYKTAREKTCGLYDMGLINENHRLTEAGKYLLDMSRTHSYGKMTDLGISYDSILYLGQLLKTSVRVGGNTVRPLIVVLYLLINLDYLSINEFRYLVPLCTDELSTSNILEQIRQLRNGKGDIDKAIKEVMLSKTNYRMGMERFVENEYSPELLLSVGMNRKSANYDKPYVSLFQDLHSVYMDKDYSKVESLLYDLKAFQSSIAIKWKKLIFKSCLTTNIKKLREEALNPLPEYVLKTDKDFRGFFFLTMHLFKAKATLEDYLGLNRRYLGLTNCFVFADEQVRLDIVPKQFFANAIDQLYKDAYTVCPRLEENCKLVDINPALVFDKNKIIAGVNRDLGTSISTINEAFDEVDKIRYQRLNKMIDSKFSDDVLQRLLDDFEERNDDEISLLVTDNADIPTIFEYIMGIVWYKVSGRKGKILHYLKLSLDANLLPVTHAAGGEADIVYEYQNCEFYPNHGLLLEATLADGTNQRRMEMEPVSRHLGRYLLRTKNKYSYCIFATSYLDINVINDFRGRKLLGYYDVSDCNNYVDIMKIIPLCTRDIKLILQYKLTYEDLYEFFDEAYKTEERQAKRWYEHYVSIETAYLNRQRSNSDALMAAEPMSM